MEIIPLTDVNYINYYIDIVEKQNLFIRKLRNRIKSQEYKRLDDDTKNKLISKEDTSVADFIKNSILIKNKYNYDDISEKMLKN